MSVPIAPEPPDVEALLVTAILGWLVRPLPASGWELHVDVQDPEVRPPGLIVKVRLDDLSASGLGLWSATVGVTVIGPESDPRGFHTGGVARRVGQVIAGLPRPGSGVASVTAQNGPYRTTGADAARPEWYQTAELTVWSR